MVINLKISFDNNLITNSSYIISLGLTINFSLSCNNHIDFLMKKLSKPSHIIRNIKIHMSDSPVKIKYHSLFQSAMSYEIIYWGNSSHISTTNYESM